MKNKIYEVKNARAAEITKAEKALEAKDRTTYDAAMAEARRLGDEIRDMEALDLEKGRFNENDERMISLDAARSKKKEESALESKSEKARSGNEYARAFAHALAMNATPQKSRGVEELAPLYNALKETGGTPEGSDGGFLVPIDFDHMIREQKRQFIQLAPYLGGENVTTLTGWRVMDIAPTTGFAKVAEMGTIPRNQQPKFTRIDYTVEKYALILPVSNELLADNVANLLAYISRWYARKDAITENLLIITLLKGLAVADIAAGNELAGIKKALNVSLDPAISTNATIITNQDGFNALDVITEDTGKPLMQPDITQPTLYRLKGRPIVVMSNAHLPSAGGKAPLYIGDGKQFATLFKRQPMEMASTDIGGGAWDTDSTEIRGITRQDIREFDKGAMIALTLPV